MEYEGTKQDPVLELVMKAEERCKLAAQAFDAISKKYHVQAIIVEIRRGGQTMSLGIDWVPEENLDIKKSPLIKL